MSEHDETTYRPIPVDAARRIAHEFAKDWVIILAFDGGHSKTHCTTFATGPGDKALVADLSEVCLKAIGICIDELKVYEDFRLVPAAESAKQIGDLKNEVDRLKWQLARCHSTMPGPGRE